MTIDELNKERDKRVQLAFDKFQIDEVTDGIGKAKEWHRLARARVETWYQSELNKFKGMLAYAKEAD